MSDTPVSAPVAESGELAPKIDTPITETKPEPRKIKVKPDGQEMELTEEELARDYERKQASYKRMEEAAKLRKEAEEILSLPKKDLNKFLREQGVTMEALTDILAARLEEDVDEKTLTPEQKKAKQDAAKLKKYEEQEENERKQKETDENLSKVEKAKQVFDEKISTALADTGLSKDPYTIRSAALFIRSCLQAGFEPDAAEIREAIEGRVKADYQSQSSKLEGKDLVAWLGEDIVKKIRSYDLERLRAKKTSAAPQEIPKAEAPEPKTTKKMDKWALKAQVDKWANS